MELRNFEKINVFLDAHKNKEIIYQNGSLYRTIKRYNKYTYKNLDEPEMMRFNSTNGYWRVNLQGNVCYEHVVIFAITYGIEKLKEVECIDHIDADKKNNNIENLEGVTTSENNKRAKEKGLLKNQKGMNNPACTISDDNIFEIRKLWKTKNFTQKEIALRYDLSQSTISQIVNFQRRNEVNYENCNF